LPSYTFSYNPATHVATAVSSGGNNDALVIDQTGGNLEYNLNGTGASTSWGGQTVPNTAATTVNIIEARGGTGESVTFGSPAAPISTLAAHFAIPSTQVPASSSLTFDDSTGTIQAVGANAYSYNNGNFSGPGAMAAFSFTSSVAQTLGVLIAGSPLNDTFNVLATIAGTPVALAGGAGSNTVNLGSNPGTPASSTLSAIRSAVNVTDPLGTTTLNINDAATTSSAAGSLDFLAAPSSEVTGLGLASGGRVTFSGGNPGVNSLVINLGRSGGTGVTMNVASTPAGTATTINGGANANTFNLSSASAARGLGNLPGPLVINNGASGLGSLTLNDQSASGNDSYTLTGTSVSRTGSFGGLTYAGFGLGSLTLNAENTLSSGGANVININSTPDGTATTVNGENGGDTININGTGTSGTLFVTTGSTGGSTVNIAADLIPLNIMTHGAALGADAVNVGAPSASGTIAGIVGPVALLGLAPYALFVNDRGDSVGRTYAVAVNNGADTASMALVPSGSFLSFRPADLTSLTFSGGGQGNTIDCNTTPASITTSINAGAGNDAINVAGSGTGSTLIIDGQGGSNAVVLGGNATAPLGLQNFLGSAVHVVSTGGTTTLTLHDGEDTVGRTVTLDGSTARGLSPAPIDFASVAALVIDGGSGGNAFAVNGTLAGSATTGGETINTGNGSDTVDVLTTTADGPLVIRGASGNDQVNITDAGSVAGIAGPIAIDAASGETAVVVDASGDAVSHDKMLMQGAATATLAGLTPAPITYTVSAISTLTIDTSAAGNQFLTVDFSQANPIPIGAVPGLIDNAGADATSAPNSHVLNLQGTLPEGAFVSETHNAEDPAVSGPAHSGTMQFLTPGGIGLGVAYTGLQPINDTAGATLYTFNDFGSPDPSFRIADGPTIQGQSSLLFLSDPSPPGAPQFEATSIANKANVVFNTPPAAAGLVNPGLSGLVEIPTAAAGLARLTVNTPGSGDNDVALNELPPNVTTTYRGGGDEDVTAVRGTAIASGRTLALDGGPGSNTLNYDAGGLDPTVAAGALPGEVLIALPGFGSVDAVDYSQVNIVDVAPLMILPGPPRTIAGVEGRPVVDTEVGTFTLALPAILPAAAGQPPGFPAGAFTASIDWGDPAGDPMPAAVIPHASDPSVYAVAGTHTFARAGSFTVAPVLAFGGATITGLVGGANVSVGFSPVAATTGTAATAVVADAPLDVALFPIVGTEGQTIAPAPIATFIDEGGANPASDYLAALSVIDPAGKSTTIPGATITENGDAPEYTVNAPAITLPDEGTYQVVLTITDQSSPVPLAVVAAGLAMIADAPLSAGAGVTLAANTGLPPSDSVVGTFADANPAAQASDFTATIDWGDGSAASIGTVGLTADGLGFKVLGSHTYARPGNYGAKVLVTDVGGATATLTGLVRVTDAPLTGVPRAIAAVEGQDTGPIVLAIVDDPNPLAAAADLTATVLWGDPGAAPDAATVTLVGSTSSGTTFAVLGSHTYDEEGTFPVTLSVATATGVGTTFTPATGTATVSDAPLAPGPTVPVAGIAGSLLPAGAVLATFTDSDPGAAASDFSGTIDWGDDAPPSPATFTGPTGGPLSVNGTHTYLKEGDYPVGVTIADAGGSTATAHGLAAIADAPLAPTAAAGISATEGVPVAAVGLATFTDPDPAAVAGAFAAVIDWGDGSPMSTGMVSGPTGGPFTVTGSHTYTDESKAPYTINVRVTDSGGSQGSTTLTASVSDAALTAAAGASITAVEGAPFQEVPVATFHDASPQGAATDFIATIHWGDGTSSPGSITSLGRDVDGANYQVLGSHTFTRAGTFPIGVTVSDVGGATTSPAQVPAAATVADAPLSATGASIVGNEGAEVAARLAVFSDADPAGQAGDFQVTIDWGDASTPTTGLVTLDPAGGHTFQVSASHTFAEEGSYPLTVTISDTGGATTVATGTATIADAPPVAAAAQPAVATTEGQRFAGAVAAFTAVVGTNPEPIADFTATIDWGDGTPPTEGNVIPTETPGAYLVSGIHTYVDSGVNIGGSPSVPSGTFPIAVLVHDEGGGTLLVKNAAMVGDVAIALAGRLDPASDSGVSSSDAITNVTEPRFLGTSEPFARIALDAAPVSGGGAILVGQTAADSTGAWAITSRHLADGGYVITARATDASGATTVTTQILPGAGQGPLTIDTTGPQVTALRLYPQSGEIDVTFQDGLSGMDQSRVRDAASYVLSRWRPRRGTYRVSQIVPPLVAPDNPETVVLVINNGRPLPDGTYAFTILASTGALGIRDVAGNALDGAFHGAFPSGDGVPGGPFQAAFKVVHHLQRRPAPCLCLFRAARSD
jgi:hypothetical protein